MNQIVAKYKFDSSLYDFFPEFNEGFEYTYTDEYLDTEDIIATFTKTMLLMNYDAEPDEYGVLTTEEEIENVSTFAAENIVTRTIYSEQLPTMIRFGNSDPSGETGDHDKYNSLIEVLYLNGNEIIDASLMFHRCENVVYIFPFTLTNKNTSLYGIFSGCHSINSLDVSNFDTSNVTNMSYAFYTNNLTKIDLSNWNTSNTSNMNHMFYNCAKLTTLNISNWNLNNVSDLGWFVNQCNNLTEILMNDSDYNSVNKIVNELPLTTNDKNYTFCIGGIDDISKVNMREGWDTKEMYKIAQYKFDISICDNLVPEFNTGFTSYEIVDEYLDTEDITTTSIETMLLMDYDAEPDEYGVLTAEHEIENVSTFSAENIATRTIYSEQLPTMIRFGSMAGLDTAKSLLEIIYLNVSNATDMSYMFMYCTNITSLDVSDWDTSNVTNMEYMFSDCYMLSSLNANYLNTNEVTSMYAMFNNCESLTSLDLSNWNTSKVFNMNSMFSGSINLILLDLSNWITNGSDIGYMCSRCTKLETINLNNWNLNEIGWASSAFNNCTKLNLVNMKNSDVDSVNYLINLLPNRDANNFGVLNTTGIDDISQIDTAAASSKYWNIVNEEPEKIKIAEYKFNNTSYDLIPEFNSGYTYVYEDIIEGNITTRTVHGEGLPTIISFEGQSSLLEVNYLDTRGLTSAYNLFYNCANLTYIDLRNSDFSKVETIERMFNSCINLVTIDGLNDLDISKVHNMGGIFSDCRKLKEANVSNWDVSNVTNFGAAFRRCYELISIDLNNWNTSNAVIMSGVFTSCTKLISMNLSNWNMVKVTTVNQMFYGCSKLVSVNLYNHLNDNVDTLYLFGNCSALNNVKVYDSDYNTVNKIISALPTKTNTNLGTLNIAGVDDISQVNTTTAESKYWKLSIARNKIKNIKMKNGTISKVYVGNRKVKCIIKIYTRNE